MVAGGGNGRSYIVRLAVGNNGDFVVGETFDSREDEGFTDLAVGAAQGILHKSQHLVGRSDLFGGRNTLIRNDAFLAEHLVRLMELQLSLIGSLYVAFTRRLLQVNLPIFFAFLKDQFIQGAHREATEPRLKGKPFGLIATVTEGA